MNIWYNLKRVWIHFAYHIQLFQIDDVSLSQSRIWWENRSWWWGKIVLNRIVMKQKTLSPIDLNSNLPARIGLNRGVSKQKILTPNVLNFNVNDWIGMNPSDFNPKVFNPEVRIQMIWTQLACSRISHKKKLSNPNVLMSNVLDTTAYWYLCTVIHYDNMWNTSYRYG